MSKAINAEKNSDLVTVIVPVYNVAAFLPTCISSITGQSYMQLEIILIDDGSTDGSGKLCDDYALSDIRIKVIHKANGGLSSARNAGLDAAGGKYVTFIDSDDYVHRDFISILLTEMKNHNAQIGISNFKKTYSDSEYSEVDGYNTICLDHRSCIKASYESQYEGVTGASCWKIYDISLFRENNITFPEGKINEDIYTTYKLYYYAEKAIYVDCRLYFYRQRDGSIMHDSEKHFTEANMLVLDATEEAAEFYLSKHEDELAAYAINYHIRLSFGLNYKLRQSDQVSGEVKRKYFVKMKQSVNRYLKLDLLGLAKRIVYKVAITMPFDFVLTTLGV